MGWIDGQIAKFLDIDRIAEGRFAAPASKPTDEIEAALRALTTRGCEAFLDYKCDRVCFFCGQYFPDHDPGCPYVAAKALIARLDESNPS